MAKFCENFNQAAMPSDPEKNMKVAEDFLLLLLHVHVVAAAHQLLLFSSVANQSLAYLAKSAPFFYCQVQKL